MIYFLIVLAASEMLLIFATFFPSKKRLRPQARAVCVGWRREERLGTFPVEGAWGQREHPVLITRVISIQKCLGLSVPLK